MQNTLGNRLPSLYCSFLCKPLVWRPPWAPQCQLNKGKSFALSSRFTLQPCSSKTRELSHSVFATVSVNLFHHSSKSQRENPPSWAPTLATDRVEKSHFETSWVNKSIYMCMYVFIRLFYIVHYFITRLHIKSIPIFSTSLVVSHPSVFSLLIFVNAEVAKGQAELPEHSSPASSSSSLSDFVWLCWRRKLKQRNVN